MKELFLYLKDRIMQSAYINWVDLDKGQANDYEVRPPVDFPAVLIGISYPQTENHQRKLQKCTALITLKFVFDFVDDTSSSTPTSTEAVSLQYFDTIKDVHDRLQGEIEINIFKAPLERASQKEENRQDGLKVVNVVYGTWLYEKSV